jgi:hypothetical protein
MSTQRQIPHPSLRSVFLPFIAQHKITVTFDPLRLYHNFLFFPSKVLRLCCGCANDVMADIERNVELKNQNRQGQKSYYRDFQKTPSCDFCGEVGVIMFTVEKWIFFSLTKEVRELTSSRRQ